MGHRFGVGCPLSAGDGILPNFGVANRDPRCYTDPDTVDLTPRPNRHAGFGLGIHRCLGSNLARVMFESVARGVLDRMPKHRVDHATARQY